MGRISKPVLGRQLNRGHPLARGLVGAWIMNEESGDKINDLSGHGNHGILTDWASGWGVGQEGMAPILDGADDYINCGNAPSLETAAHTIHIIFEASALTNAYSTICSKFYDGNTYFQIFLKSNGKLAAYYNGPVGGMISYDGEGVHTLSTGTVYHLTATYSIETGLNTYVDTVLDNYEPPQGAMNITGSNFALGQDLNTASREFAGFIYTAYFYNRALTVTEISRLHRELYAMFEPQRYYQLSTPETVTYGMVSVKRLATQKPELGRKIDWSHPLSEGLVGAWVMNEGGEGTAGGVFDLAGNAGLSGSLTNAPTWHPDGVDFEADNSENFEITKEDALRISNGDFAIVTNFKSEGSHTGFIYAKGATNSPGNSHTLYVRTTDPYIQLWTREGAAATDLSTMSLNIHDGLYHSLVGQRFGTNLQVYVDGISRADESGTLRDVFVTDNAYIGCRFDTGVLNLPFDGILKYVYIYNRALTAAEISQLHRDPYAMFEQPSIFYTVEAPVGRTTKNTDPWALGQNIGQSFRVVT